MKAAFQPNAYTAFISVLGKDSAAQQSITQEQLLGGLAYYLTELPHTYVQAFVTITLCSPALWGPSPRNLPFDKIHPAAWGVMQAIKQAVVAKHKALLADPNKSSILPPLARQRVSMAFKEWLGLLVSGSQPRAGPSDCSIPRLAFLSGLVLGLQELQNNDVRIPSGSFSLARAELAISVAECLDQYAAFAPTDTWDARLALQIRETETHLDTIIQLCAISLPQLPNKQLEALDLSKLVCVCFGAILNVFQGGHCFDLLETDITKLESGQLDFKPESKLPGILKNTHASTAYVHLGSTAKLIGHLFVGMSQPEFWQQKLYRILDTCLGGLSDTSLNLEKAWSRSAFCAADADEKIAIDARPTTTIVWNMLKGFLFTTVLVAQSALDTIIYYNTTTPQEGKALSQSVLTTLCRLSFISLKFGALTAEGGGFSGMKRAFFGALDVLASNANDLDLTGDRSSAELVTSLASELSDIESSVGVTRSIYQSRVAYFLVCAEHVMNQLTEETIERVVLPITQRHLSESNNREIYEAAHSVMLTIFATSESGPIASHKLSPLSRAHLLVPAYIKILLQESDEGKLSSDQFCLAFQALVRAAGSRGDELSWFCVEELKVAISRLSADFDQSSGSAPNEQALRLQLALISSISVVPAPELPRLLETIRDQLVHCTNSRDVLAKATYHEIMERLGDREKDQALEWWMKLENGF